MENRDVKVTVKFGGVKKDGKFFYDDDFEGVDTTSIEKLFLKEAEKITSRRLAAMEACLSFLAVDLPNNEWEPHYIVYLHEPETNTSITIDLEDMMSRSLKKIVDDEKDHLTTICLFEVLCRHMNTYRKSMGLSDVEARAVFDGEISK